jgi:DNA end-binding protein Ku
MPEGTFMPCSTRRSKARDGLRCRVVIAQRDRTIALRPMEGGLVAHTLHEQRDINDAKAAFEDGTAIKTNPEMIAPPRQLTDRQTITYDPSEAA